MFYDALMLPRPSARVSARAAAGSDYFDVALIFAIETARRGRRHFR